MKRTKWLLAGWLGATALGGLALAASQQLYVQTSTAGIYDKPGGRAGTQLKLGDTVEWLGVAGTPGWHKVKHGSDTGVMYKSTLGTHAPAAQLTASNNTVSSKDLGESSAASKALSEGAVKYGETANHEDAVKQLLTAEAVGAQTTSDQIAAQAKHSQVSWEVKQ